MPLVSVHGHTLEYSRLGPPPDAAPTLVFLHEGLGSLAQWRDLPAALAAATGCGALVYSRAGYGGSSAVPVAPRSIHALHDEAIDVLPRLLDLLAVRRAILVGHSDGASIALVHAARPLAAARVVALVLEAPHVFVEDATIASIERARDAYRDGGLRARLRRWHGDNVDCAFWGWNGMWLDPAFRAWNIEAEVARVRAPMLLIQGLDDPYGTVAQLDAIARAAAGPVETLLLPQCGHSPHRDQREATLSAMATFVRARSAAG